VCSLTAFCIWIALSSIVSYVVAVVVGVSASLPRLPGGGKQPPRPCSKGYLLHLHYLEYQGHSRKSGAAVVRPIWCIYLRLRCICNSCAFVWFSQPFPSPPSAGPSVLACPVQSCAVVFPCLPCLPCLPLPTCPRVVPQQNLQPNELRRVADITEIPITRRPKSKSTLNQASQLLH
jgi:hypothetical protein